MPFQIRILWTLWIVVVTAGCGNKPTPPVPGVAPATVPIPQPPVAVAHPGKAEFVRAAEFDAPQIVHASPNQLRGHLTHLKTALAEIEPAREIAAMERARGESRLLAVLQLLGIVRTQLPFARNNLSMKSFEQLLKLEQEFHGPKTLIDVHALDHGLAALDGELRVTFLESSAPVLAQAIAVLEAFVDGKSGDDAVELSPEVAAAYDTHFFLRPATSLEQFRHSRDQVWDRIRNALEGDSKKVTLDQRVQTAIDSGDADRVLTVLEGAQEFDRHSHDERHSTHWTMPLDRVSALFGALPNPGATFDERVRLRRWQALQLSTAREVPVRVPSTPLAAEPLIPSQTIEARARVSGVSVSADGGQLVIFRSDHDKKDHLYRLPGTTPAAEFDALSGTYCDNLLSRDKSLGVFSPDGQFFATSENCDTLTFFQTDPWTQIRIVQMKSRNGVNAILSHPRGGFIAQFADRTTKRFSTQGELIQEYQNVAYLGRGVSPATQISLSALPGPTFITSKLRSVSTSDCLARIFHDVEPTRFTHALCRFEKCLQIVPLRSAVPIREVDFNLGYCAFDPQGVRIALIEHGVRGSYDQDLAIMSWPDLVEIRRIQLPENTGVQELRFTPDGKHLLFLTGQGLTVFTGPEMIARNFASTGDLQHPRAFSSQSNTFALTYTGTSKEMHKVLVFSLE